MLVLDLLLDGLGLKGRKARTTATLAVMAGSAWLGGFSVGRLTAPAAPIRPIASPADTANQQFELRWRHVRVTGNKESVAFLANAMWEQPPHRPVGIRPAVQPVVVLDPDDPYYKIVKQRLANGTPAKE